MDYKMLREHVQRMSPTERVARFAQLDRWFSENPNKATPVFVGSPTGIPSTPPQRQDAIAERLELALRIARDAVAAQPTDWRSAR